MTSPFKILIVGSLVLWGAKGPAAAETTAELLYFPPTSPAEAGGEGYLLVIKTKAEVNAKASNAQIVLTCSAAADDAAFSLLGEDAKAIPVATSDPEKPGELHGARFEAGTYVANVTMDWVRWDENEIEGVFTSSEDLSAFVRAVASAPTLGAEAFGHRYTFDMNTVTNDINEYLQGCFALSMSTD